MQVKVNPNDFWTEVEVADHKLPPHYIGTLKALYFNLEDWGNGLCSKEQIYKLKPEALRIAQEAQEVLEAKEATYAEKLSDLAEAAVDTVLNHPGGAKKWFQDNPSAHVRVLVKLATPAAPEQQARVVIEIPWLQQGRLSYKDSAPIEQVQDVEPKSWKPAQDPAIGAEVAILKKDFKGG